MRAAFSLDGEDSPTFASARRRGSLGGRPSYGRRCAHEYAREGGYERDTTFYSEMAAGEAPHTSIRGLSSSLDRARSERLSSGAPLWPSPCIGSTADPPHSFHRQWLLHAPAGLSA